MENVSQDSSEWGGAREGAGKPKGMVASRTLQTQLFREELIKRMSAKADQFYEAWEALALGHYVAVTDEDGKITSVYKKPPDARALKDMVDHAYGKAPQHVTLVGDQENPIRVIQIGVHAGYDDNPAPPATT